MWAINRHSHRRHARDLAEMVTTSSKSGTNQTGATLIIITVLNMHDNLGNLLYELPIRVGGSCTSSPHLPSVVSDSVLSVRTSQTVTAV
jgi:hypothetical protein